MKFAVTVISPSGYIHSAAFHEIAETFYYGLRSLGHDCVLTTETQLAGRQHIVFGSNLLPAFPQPLARDAILYNLEQVQHDSPWISPALIDLFSRHAVWDYSEQNVISLAELGIHVSRLVPIGYASELTRISRAVVPDIDVLFFGSIGPRRQAVIDEMRRVGLKVEAVFGIYGQERDTLIGRARVVLNVHHYEAKVLEMVRISYLLANRCAVLSEHSSNPLDDVALNKAIAFSSYSDLANVARALIDAPDECEQLAQNGFDLMRSRPISHYLQAALSAGAAER